MNQLHATFEAIFKDFGVYPEPIEMQNYRAALKRHDWDHEFSDDPLIYKRGREKLWALRKQQSILDPFFRVWNELSPARFHR